MIASCEGSEAKYIIRSLEGKLRIGLAERSVIIALAHAFVTAKNDKEGKKPNTATLAKEMEEASDILKSVFSEIPSYDAVVPALLDVGLKGLPEACKMTPGKLYVIV